MPEHDDDTPPVLWVPSDRVWIDPLLVGRTLYTQMSTVVADAVVPVLAVPANPMRWALGFSMGPGSTLGLIVAPWSDTIGDSGQAIGSGQIVWYTLTLHGPLVQGQWWLAPATGPVARVVEVIRQA